MRLNNSNIPVLIESSCQFMLFLNVPEMFSLWFFSVLMFFVALWNTFCLLKLDLTYTCTLSFLSVSQSTFQKWKRSLEIFEEAAMKSKMMWVFLFFSFFWGKSRLFSSLCLTSQYWSVSSIEAMLSFTSFLYFISWFPVHVEAYSWSVSEPLSKWFVRNKFCIMGNRA